MDKATSDVRRPLFKLNDVDPDLLAYLTDVLARIVNGHPNSDIYQLLPWSYRQPNLKAVA